MSAFTGHRGSRRGGAVHASRTTCPAKIRRNISMPLLFHLFFSTQIATDLDKAVPVDPREKVLYALSTRKQRSV